MKTKLDSIKIKNFYASKDVIKNVKTQTPEWETVFPNDIFVKCLAPRNCKSSNKELLQVDNKKDKKPN